MTDFENWLLKKFSKEVWVYRTVEETVGGDSADYATFIREGLPLPEIGSVHGGLEVLRVKYDDNMKRWYAFYRGMGSDFACWKLELKHFWLSAYKADQLDHTEPELPPTVPELPAGLPEGCRWAELGEALPAGCLLVVGNGFKVLGKCLGVNKMKHQVIIPDKPRTRLEWVALEVLPDPYRSADGKVAEICHPDNAFNYYSGRYWTDEPPEKVSKLNVRTETPRTPWSDFSGEEFE